MLWLSVCIKRYVRRQLSVDIPYSKSKTPNDQPVYFSHVRSPFFWYQQGDTEKFPESCTDFALNQLECAVAKREYAYNTAVQLAGKTAVNKVMPKYEESMQKATELIELYKSNASGEKLKKDVFWG